MFLTSLKQTCNEYLIKFSENQGAPKLENRKTSPCSLCAPNLLHVLPSRMVGWRNLCNPAVDMQKLLFLSNQTCHLHVCLAQQFNEKGEGLPLGADQEAPDNNDEEDEVVIIMITE